MTDAQAIVDSWKRQLDDLVPLLEKDRRRGNRVRVKLYVATDVGQAQYVALPWGQLDKGRIQV